MNKLQGPKTVLKKDKLRPFGSHHLTKLNSANSKLMCSLSGNALEIDAATKYLQDRGAPHYR